MRLVIFGSRDFDDYDTLESWVDAMDKTYGPIEEIVSGTARGADSLGEIWAKAHHIPLKRFPADWDRYGKAAGYRRNADMAQYATHALGFWDGASRGTKHMIDLCSKQNLTIWVVDF